MSINFTPNQIVPELSVSDIQKSMWFYTEVLGFQVAYQREDEGFAYLVFEKVQIMIDQIGIGRDWKTGEMSYPFGRGINFEIEVSDLDKLLKKVSAANIKLYLEPEEKWYRKNDKEVGNKQFLVQDPDGYLLRFSQDLGERTLKNHS